MIIKIISGGQTGADQAALDVAIDFYVPHGGWMIPRGGKTDYRLLLKKYRLKEISSNNDQQAIERNVADSDGTLIVSRGRLTGTPALTQKLAAKHSRPYIHVDPDKADPDKMLEMVVTWIDARDIEALNITGPEESKDKKIYEDTRNLVASIIRHYTPKTVEEAVDLLISELPLDMRTIIAKANEHVLSFLHAMADPHVINRFGLCEKDSELLKSCRAESGKKIDRDEAVRIILFRTWKELQKTHSLRRVK